MLTVDDLDVVIDLNVRGQNRPLTFLAQAQGDFVTAVQLDGQTLEIEQDLDHVFLHAFDGAVLVQDTVDLCFDYRAARHGGQQDTPQRVAQGMAETTLERLEGDLGTGLTNRLHIDMAGGQELIYRTLHGCTYFLALTWSRARQSGFR